MENILPIHLAVIQRRLTRQHDPVAYLRMLQRAHEFSATISGDDMDAMKVQLEECNAFKAHGEAMLRIAAVDF